MFSKLYHYEFCPTPIKADTEFMMSALINYFSSKGRTISIHTNDARGTLGLFCNILLDGKQKFVKTHLPGPMYKSNLMKEYYVLKHLYGDLLDIEVAEIPVNDLSYLFLIMDILQPLDALPDVQTIQRLVHFYWERFLPFDVSKVSRLFFYNFKMLQDKGFQALDILEGKNLISEKLAAWVSQCLSEGLKNIEFGDSVICHGDLSNKNLMLDNGRIVVIDWEDSFLGPKEYDLVYWLTFLDQRKYYKRSFLKEFDLYHEQTRYLMVLIVILKSYLSFLNGSYLLNRLSFEERLQEIMDLF